MFFNNVAFQDAGNAEINAENVEDTHQSKDCIKTDTMNAVQSTPVCDLKLPRESTSVGSTKRKQPNLEVGTPTKRRTRRNLNASAVLDTPGTLKTLFTQIKATEECKADFVERDSVAKQVDLEHEVAVEKQQKQNDSQREIDSMLCMLYLEELCACRYALFLKIS